MRFDRTPESYRHRALTAERLAEHCAREGERQWARIWREIADDMRATALRLMLAPLPPAEMAVVGGAL